MVLQNSAELMPQVLPESDKHTGNQTIFFSGGILFPQEF